MNIKLQRWIDRYLGQVLCSLGSLFSTRRKTPTQDPRSILVILLSEMGSLVLAYPMFNYLRTRYPDARLYSLVFRKNREVLELLEVMEPDAILTINDTSAGAFIGDSLGVIRRLRKLKLDAVVDCELFARVSSLLSLLSGAPLRAGFHRHTQEGLYRGSFINRPALYNPYLHIGQQFLTLALALESETYPRAKRKIEDVLPAAPSKQFAEDEVVEYFNQLFEVHPGLAASRLVLVYPGGGALPIRAWPLDNYKTLCKSMLGDGICVGVIGLSEDKPLAQDIVAYCSSEHCVDLTGYTRNIRELLILFQRTDLLITNDGGPGHFAALTPASTIVLFGPETPQLYGSLSPNAHILFSGLSCSPCVTAYNHRSSPCDGDNQCLKTISTEMVVKKARDVLAGADRVAPGK